jgi:hypothetical protein
MTSALKYAVRKIILIVKDEVGSKCMTIYNEDLYRSPVLARAVRSMRA